MTASESHGSRSDSSTLCQQRNMTVVTRKIPPCAAGKECDIAGCPRSQRDLGLEARQGFGVEAPGLSPVKKGPRNKGASQAAEKLRMNDERAKFGGCETINQPSRIVPRASWCDPFFALSDKLSFSAACLAPGFSFMLLPLSRG